MLQDQGSRPDLPDSLSVSSLLKLSRGRYEMRYSPLGRSAEMDLLYRSTKPAPLVSAAGSFYVACKGMFNTSEEAKLVLNPHTISFPRRGYHGDWLIDGSLVARTRIGFWRRWIWCGYSETTMNDGIIFRMAMPTIGPSSTQKFNCVSTVNFRGKMCIHVFIAKPHRQTQFIFDQSEAGLLENLPEWTRGVMLGEYLRFRALYEY